MTRVIAVLAFALFAQSSFATTLSRNVLDVVDINPAPNVFEAQLSVDEQDVTIGGTTVHTLIYKDLNNPAAYMGTPDGIPVPQMIVELGDEIVVTVTNNLSPSCAAIACDTSIHFHGIEVDNDSDGTGVTQNHIAPGETYTYRFRTFRPGIFWFHPHMKPGPQVFAGVYGAFIVRDPDEAQLVADAKIPSAANTHTLLLSDIEFDSGGDVGFVNTGTAVPWATLKAECEAGTGPSCRKVSDGATVLINGQVSDTTTPVIKAKSGAGIRLRLINSATSRYFRLNVAGNGADNNLYRIGGEGGFLEFARLEGGTLGSWNTDYDQGEILLPSSARADVVIVPTGNNGDIITISGTGYARGGPSSLNPAGNLLYIEIDNSLSDTPFSIAAGSDVLGAGAIEDIKSAPLDFLLDPVPMLPGPGSGMGSSNETILLDTVMTGSHSIDGVPGNYEDSGADYTQVPYQASTRYANTGDLIELTITQDTNLHHPWHHHGFSFQPVRILDSVGTVLYDFDYQEFQDVIDIFDAEQVVIRLRLDDRTRITDNRQEVGAPAPDQFFASGGAAGRWVFHCHMFLHAAIGMISELVVLDTDRDGDGFDTSLDCDDFDSDVYVGAPEINDGLDNQCESDSGFAAVDEIGGISGFTNLTDLDEFSWTAQSGATSYRVARSTRADFSDDVATFTTSGTLWSDATQPAAGEPFFYMVRAVAPSSGSWGLTSSDQERSINILLNGALEDWPSSTNAASWSESSPGGDIEQESDPAQVFTGDFAGRLTRTAGGSLLILQNDLPLEPGQSYTLSLAARFSQASADALQVRLNNTTSGSDLQANGSWSGSVNFFTFAVENGYQTVTLPFTVDAGFSTTDAIRLIVKANNSTPIGTMLWLDDLRIEE